MNIADHDMVKWYDYGKVKPHPVDGNTKCSYYDEKFVDGKVTFSRYYVETLTNKEHTMTGYSNVYLDKDYYTIVFDNIDVQIDSKVLCLNSQFEISYFGELSDG